MHAVHYCSVRTTLCCIAFVAHVTCIRIVKCVENKKIILTVDEFSCLIGMDELSLSPKIVVCLIHRILRKKRVTRMYCLVKYFRIWNLGEIASIRYDTLEKQRNCNTRFEWMDTWISSISVWLTKIVTWGLRSKSFLSQLGCTVGLYIMLQINLAKVENASASPPGSKKHTHGGKAHPDIFIARQPQVR
jgi:hypothetical protein